MKYLKSLLVCSLVLLSFVVVVKSYATIGSPGNYAAPGRINFASTNVTTGAWSEIISSTNAAIKGITVYSTTSTPIQVGVGAAGSEVGQLVTPGATAVGTFYPMAVSAGARIAVEAVGSTASTGEIEINAIYN